MEIMKIMRMKCMPASLKCEKTTTLKQQLNRGLRCDEYVGCCLCVDVTTDDTVVGTETTISFMSDETQLYYVFEDTPECGTLQNTHTRNTIIVTIYVSDAFRKVLCLSYIRNSTGM